MTTETPAPAPEAPVVAPAAEPIVLAPAPAPEPAKGTVDPKTPAAVEDKPFVFETTGNAQVDYALDIIGKAGISNEHPAALAAFNGDFTLLKHALAAKGIPGGDHLVAMLEKAATDDAAKDAAIADQISQDVYEMAGSQEQWQAVQAWAAANADEGEKETLNALFSDTKTHKIAAAYVINQYNAAGNVKPEAAAVVSKDAGAARPAAATGGPLSRVEFAEEAAKLRQRFGNEYTNSPEYQVLGRRLQR